MLFNSESIFFSNFILFCTIIILPICVGQGEIEIEKENNYPKLIGQHSYYTNSAAIYVNEMLSDQSYFQFSGKFKQILNDRTEFNVSFYDVDHNLIFKLWLDITKDQGIVWNVKNFPEGFFMNNNLGFLKANRAFNIHLRVTDTDIQVFRDGVMILPGRASGLSLAKVHHFMIDGPIGVLNIIRFKAIPAQTNSFIVFPIESRLDLTIFLQKKNKYVINNEPHQDCDISIMDTSGGYEFRVTISDSKKQVLRSFLIADQTSKSESEGTYNIEHVFDMTIVNDKNQFKVFVNGENFTTFEHQADDIEYDGLKISDTCEVLSKSINRVVGIRKLSEF